MSEHVPNCEQSMADLAFARLVARLWEGALTAGQFLSMPQLVDLLDLPLAATREAVKRAEARELVSILPKRGLQVMTASPDVVRNCLDLRTILEEQGARRLIETSAALPLDTLRADHHAVLDQWRPDMGRCDGLTRLHHRLHPPRIRPLCEPVLGSKNG